MWIMCNQSRGTGIGLDISLVQNELLCFLLSSFKSCIMVLWQNHPVVMLLLLWDSGESDVASKTTDAGIILPPVPRIKVFTDSGRNWYGKPRISFLWGRFLRNVCSQRKKIYIYISQRSLRLFQIHFHFSINFMSDVSHKMK